MSECEDDFFVILNGKNLYMSDFFCTFATYEDKGGLPLK